MTLQRAKWPGSLRTALSILIKTPNECVICEDARRPLPLPVSSANPRLPLPARPLAGWGPEFIMLYNDLHAKSIGNQHPASFGRPAAEAWGETWSEYKAMAESVMNDGAALAREDDLIFLNEVETYQSWRWTPLTRGDGTTGPFFAAFCDIPRGNIADHSLPLVRLAPARSRRGHDQLARCHAQDPQAALADDHPRSFDPALCAPLLLVGRQTALLTFVEPWDAFAASSRTIAEFSENVLKVRLLVLSLSRCLPADPCRLRSYHQTVEQSPEDFAFAYLYAAKVRS